MTGVLSGFDRLRLRGTLRHLFQPTVMEAYLNAGRVLIKDFGTFAQSLTARIKATAYATAEQAGRPFRYLANSQISKEALARQIAREDGVTSGLIAIFSALENCLSSSVRGDRQTKHIHLVLEPRKCLHLYHYFLHEELGLCHVRVQTWFPFTVDLCLNGRDRLARQMDQAGRAYRQRDNCFVWVEDAPRAQRLLDQQLRTDWPRLLGRLLDQAHPLHQEICRPIAQTYYWTASALLTAVSRGEYTINGLRNRDLRRQLWPKVGCDDVERRRAGAVTRALRLLRAHGLLRKVSGTHRYVVTESGRKIITALLAARQADVEQLTALAA